MGEENLSISITTAHPELLQLVEKIGAEGQGDAKTLALAILDVHREAMSIANAIKSLADAVRFVKK